MIQTNGANRQNNHTVTGKAPRFETAEAWLEHYEHSTRNGHRAWPPATREELLLADEYGLFEQHPQWIPCRVGLRLLNLPDCFGRTLDPYGEQFKERFLSTLNADTVFASAVLNLLKREG